MVASVLERGTRRSVGSRRSGRQSLGTRSRRAGRRAVHMDAAPRRASSATGGSRRPACSISRTRKRRSPTPRSGCRRARADSLITNRAARRVAVAPAGNSGPRRRRRRGSVLGSIRVRRSAALSGDPITTTPQCVAHERIMEQYPTSSVRTPGHSGRAARPAAESMVGRRRKRGDDLHVYEVDDDGRIGMRPASTRTTSRAPTASSTGATTPEKAQRSPKRVRRRRLGDRIQPAPTMTGYSASSPSPEVRFENRSRSVFPDRSAAQFRESVEELDAMVASSRTWHAVISGCRRLGRRATASGSGWA